MFLLSWFLFVKQLKLFLDLVISLLLRSISLIIYSVRSFDLFTKYLRPLKLKFDPHNFLHSHVCHISFPIKVHFSFFCLFSFLYLFHFLLLKLYFISFVLLPLRPFSLHKYHRRLERHLERERQTEKRKEEE